MLYLFHNQFQSSLKLFLKVLEIDPQNVIAFSGLATICLYYYIDCEEKSFSKAIAEIDYQEKIKEFQNILLEKAKSYANFSLLSRSTQKGMLFKSLLQVCRLFFIIFFYLRFTTQKMII